MWHLNGAPLTDEQKDQINEQWYGFIYLITNTETGRKYVGRKYLTKAGYKQVNGKRKKIRKVSDWETYFGSSPSLLEDIQATGKDNFKREIVRLCKTRGEVNYQETKLLFDLRVLEYPDSFYNANIAVKYSRRNIGYYGEVVHNLNGQEEN